MSAVKKLALATYKYNHIDDGVEQLQKRYVPKVFERNAAPVLFVVKLVTEQQLTFAWSFP